jgi:hypothetical protein
LFEKVEMSYNLLVHKTWSEIAYRLKDKDALTEVKNKYANPFIETQYIFNELGMDGIKKEYGETYSNDVILLIRPEILRDQPALLCDKTESNVSCLESDKIVFEGDYETIPNTDNLKKYIIEIINKKTKPTYDYYKNLYNYEILFESIPKEYIVGMFVSKKDIDKFKKVFKNIMILPKPIETTPIRIKKYILPYLIKLGNQYAFTIDKIKRTISFNELKNKNYTHLIDYYTKNIKTLEETIEYKEERLKEYKNELKTNNKFLKTVKNKYKSSIKKMKYKK